MAGGNRLLIANLPANCPDDRIRQWIESHGYRVSSITLIHDVVSGTSPSFAHVGIIEDNKLDEAAERLDGSTLGGRTVSVHRLRARAAAPLRMSRTAS